MNFDHYANVAEDTECFELVKLKQYYNPNSNHWLSKETNETQNVLNNIVHKIFHMYKTIEFIPSGGTGANIRAILENTLIKNVAIPELNDVIMISCIEHSSIIKKVTHELNIKGYTIILFPVNANGFIDIDIFTKLFNEYENRVVLVSCISTNNEIGTHQPIESLISIVKNSQRNIIFHSDCACDLAHILNYKIFPDIITFSCYKFHGPHIGMLLTNVKLNENKFGTPDIKNFYFASLALDKYISNYNNISNLQSDFKMKLKTTLYSAMSKNEIEFIDFDTNFSANTVLSFAIIGIKTSLVQKELNKLNIAIGSGSACTTNEGSHTIIALGYSPDLSRQLIRLSFNYIDHAVIENFVEKFIDVINSLKYLKKETDVMQKIIKFTLIKPSVRKAIDGNTVPIFDIKSLNISKINVIQLSSAEQALKGKNKNKFNEIMTNNIKITIAKKFPNLKYKLKSTEDFHMLHLHENNYNINDILDILSKMPGISVVSPFEYVENYEKIESTVISHFNDVFSNKNLSFSVRVKITGKTLNGRTNKDWEYYLGKTIQENFLANVNLENPNITIYVKGYSDKIYIGTQRIIGMSGIPAGSEGNIIFFVDKLNLNYSRDSILKMYIRGTNPIVFTNDDEIYKTLNIFLEENCIKYTLKYILKEDIDNELVMLEDSKHFVCETNLKNIFEMKQFGKKHKKYVFSNYMFENNNLESELFANNENNKNNEKYNGLVLISGGFDSPVASHLLLTNGFEHDYIHFIDNINDNLSREKILKLVNVLKSKSKIYFVEFGKLQEEIAKKCDETYRVMMYKIYMVLITNKISKANGYNYIAMGNSLGQVASQTPQNLYVTDYYSEIPILSPLVGMNKNDIIEYARKIGTSKISECNGNDCCVQFLPSKPVLSASIKKINNMLNLIGNDFEQFININEYELN